MRALRSADQIDHALEFQLQLLFMHASPLEWITHTKEQTPTKLARTSVRRSHEVGPFPSKALYTPNDALGADKGETRDCYTAQMSQEDSGEGLASCSTSGTHIQRCVRSGREDHRSTHEQACR